MIGDVQPHLRRGEAADVRARSEVLDLELAAQPADQGALQPQRHVQAEEPEHAEQQQRHEQVDVVDPRVLVPVHRVAVRDEGQERSVDLALVAAARAAGRCQVVGVGAGARVGGAQVVVRRVAVGAQRHLVAADRRGLAVEAVMERLVDVLVAVAAFLRHLAHGFAARRRLDRVRLVAGAAHRAVLAVAPQRAMRAFAPFLQHAFVAAAAHLRALLVRGARAVVVVALDVVAAVAVAAGRRRFGQARLEQRARMRAGQVAVHDVFVAGAAVLHLVERRHGRLRVVAADDGVDAAVAGLAGRGLVALDPRMDAVLERRDFVFVAIHADVEGDRAERLALALVLDRQCGRVALDTGHPLVRAGGERRLVHRDRPACLILHLGVVMAAEALGIGDGRLARHRVDGRRWCCLGRSGGGRRCGLLCVNRNRTGNSQEQRGPGQGGEGKARGAMAEHAEAPLGRRRDALPAPVTPRAAIRGTRGFSSTSP